MITQEDTKDLQKSGKYFAINQSNASKIEFNFEAPVQKEINEHKGVKGIIYMSISAVLYTLMAFLLKVLYLNTAISTYEFTYFQSLVMVLLNFASFKTYGKDHLLVRDDMRTTLVVRSIFAFIGATGFYLALQYTELSKATALYWTNPMMTAVLAYFVLNETLNFVDWLAIFVSFFGILVIQSPWEKEVAANRTFYDYVGTIAAIVGAFFFAIAQMQTRKLGKKVHFLVPPFYQSIFTAFVSPVIMIIVLRYRQGDTSFYGWYEALLIILISICLFTAQVFQTKAFQNDKAGRVAPVMQLQIIFNWILDFVVIGTRPMPNEIVGGLLIIGSNLLVSALRACNLIK